MLLANHPNFRLLWIGQLVSQMGDKVFAMTLSWWILELTTSPEYPRGSASMVGYVMAASSLPSALFGPVVGSLADRHSRKGLMILADLSRAALVGVFIALSVTGIDTHLKLLAIFPIAFLITVFNLMFNPCVQAILGSLIERHEFTEALSLQSMTRDSSNLMGAALGGGLVAAVGVTVGFGLNAGSFLFSALMIALIKVKAQPVVPRSLRSGLSEGFAYVRGNSTVFRLLQVFALFNLFLMPIFVLIPAIARIVLKGTAGTLGILEASMATGSLFAALVVVGYLRKVARFPVLLATLLLAGAMVLVMGVYPDLYVVCPGLFALGACLAAVNINLRALFQETIPDEMKGRVFSLIETLSTITFPLSFFIVGQATTYLSVPQTLIACGCGSLLAGLQLLRVPGIRQL